MKVLFTFSFLLLFLNISIAQERLLIKETDSIQLFETHLSNISDGNIFPSFYKNGLVYVSDFNSKYFQVFYSDLNSESIKIPLKGKFHFGSVCIFGNDIYFTGKTREYNSTILKGVIEGFKVTKVKKLPFCNDDFTYSDPVISKDGKQLVVVSSEKDIFHLIEFVKNENNEWEKKSVPYISHPSFDIINPTIYDENTIYFSANIYKGAVKKVNYAKDENGKIIIQGVEREEGAFNIYKVERTKGAIWGIPEKVNALNSEFDELGVIFDSENTGYLTTFRFNSNDNIYYFKLKQ